VAPERKYALRRIKAGDYLLFSNDATTLWRISRYEDGPSHGLDDWPKDRTFWAIWKWETPIVMGETAIEIDNWDRWEFVEGFDETRQSAIDSALKLDPSPQDRKAE
jgi:hypothetical protein